MKKIIKTYLQFSRKEAAGLVILLLTMLVLLYLPKWYAHKQPIVIKAYPKESSTTPVALVPAPPVTATKQLIVFNPNTIGLDEWIGMGVAAKTAQTIINYRNKGGRFRTPTDIYKIWGMRKELADSLLPYIRIKLESPEVRKSHKSSFIVYRPSPTIHSLRSTVSRININTATAAEWESLPGIGKVLATRIIRFRDKLGGFKAETDIAKTYGLQDSVFQQIKPYLYMNETLSVYPEIPSKVNINKASESEMVAAGIAAEVASAICLSRKQEGNFKSLEALKRIIFIRDAVYNQLLEKCSVD